MRAEQDFAARALEIGLVNRVVTAEALLPAAREMALKLAQLPTKAIGQAKRQLNLALSGSLDEVLEAGPDDIAAELKRVWAEADERGINVPGKINAALDWALRACRPRR